jgi:CO/xanthine dehydrogenase Mo-binding subunit
MDDCCPAGVGEPSCCPVWAAIGNAIFDATGVRVRETPLRLSSVKNALKSA